MVLKKPIRETLCHPFLMEKKIPDDILIQIFLRLPRDSLLRCGLASKAWLRLTSDPFFLRCYRSTRPPMLGFFCNRHPPNTPPRFIPTNKSITKFTFNIALPLENSCLVGSSRHLLLFGTSNGRSFHVFNLATQEWTAIPQLTGRVSRRWAIGFVHESASSTTTPRGFKVIRIGPTLAVQTFSSTVGRWKRSVPEYHPHDFGTTFKYWPDPSGVAVDDRVLHWFYSETHLLCYDVDTSCFSVVKLPVERISHHACLSRSEGRLRYVLFDRRSPRIQTWALRGKSRNQAWHLEHDMNLWPLAKGDLVLTNLVLRCYYGGSSFYGSAKMMGLDGSDCNLVFLHAMNGKVFSCDLQRGELKHVCDLDFEMVGSMFPFLRYDGWG
ncbi:F-box protein At5g07610-like [Elaeis guineensis]|uniref:F-box protein At5g07610-like n=1 Tax=Elaeis guineensis var. tenera TaxID=51953 RepID=UPI003C6D5CA4